MGIFFTLKLYSFFKKRYILRGFSSLYLLKAQLERGWKKLREIWDDIWQRTRPPKIFFFYCIYLTVLLPHNKDNLVQILVGLRALCFPVCVCMFRLIGASKLPLGVSETVNDVCVLQWTGDSSNNISFIIYFNIPNLFQYFKAQVCENSWFVSPQ